MLFLNIVLIFLKLDYRFPVCLPTFLNRMNVNETYYQGIKTFVNCNVCHAIYDIPSSNEQKQNRQHCTFVNSISNVTDLPLSRCYNKLYKVSKNDILNPFPVFVYNSIITTLRRFFLREGFMDNINSWRNGKVQLENYMFDIMDVNVWKTFKVNDDDDVPFVKALKSNIVMSLNIDWYQPYSNSVYSVGVIYMTILNLDRKIRNLRSNVIFVGLLPGPTANHHIISTSYK